MGFGVNLATIQGYVTSAHETTNALINALRLIADAVEERTDNLPDSPANQATLVLVKAKTDSLPSDPADQSDLEDILGRKYPFMDFWSAPPNQNKITVKGAAADLDFPSVVVSGLPSTATLKRVVVILTIRAILDTSTADNYIDQASKTLRVKKSTGAWATDDVIGITFDQNSLYCVASTKEAGPAIIGAHDVKGEVDGDATYNFRSVETTRGDAISALADDLELYDVQVGLRVFYE